MMVSRGSLVCAALLFAALSATAVKGGADADLQGGRKLLTGGQNQPPMTPAWISQDGKVFAIQGNALSGNTVQVGFWSSQKANSAAVNNAQNNQNAGGHSSDGNVVQSIQGRKLLNGGQNQPPMTPAWISQDGKVFAIQGNALSGNTVQVGFWSSQKANSAAVNNAQNNQNAGGHSQDGNVGQSIGK